MSEAHEDTQNSTDTTETAEHDRLQYDIAVIGAGPGGYSAALRASELGKHVVIIERDAVVGGTCLNRGCIPTKALITSVGTINEANHAQSTGIKLEFQGIDFGELRDHRERMVSTMTEGLAALLKHRKVDVIHGQASISGTGELTVQNDDSTQTIKATDIIIATGSRPRPLPDIPFSDVILDSDHALTLDTFPDSAVIIGSGAIALEFASLWNTAGCKVTLLARKDRVISGWSKRAGVTLGRELKRSGINLITHASCTGIDTGDNLGATVHYKDEHDDEQQVEADVVLVAIGRQAATDAQWFADAGIDLDGHGLVNTDELGQSSVEHVWAVGDITPGHQLAHRAFEQGITVAEAIAGLEPRGVDDNTVPQIVFSTPEAAAVGMTLDAAQEDDTLVSVKETAYPMMSNARVLMTGQGGSLSVVTGCDESDPDTPVVLGAQIIGPHASEMIAEAEQLVGNRVPLADAARLIHPHPTFSEAFGESLLKADERPLHVR
ncbi:dihydrolipoyl dehydrogenase [Bifidobacterium psychraerophilum]|uniref:dihydrolipoyl dehydrogenase n=1 Tax=Bifidobacterium psychraerophilum TaxID=218140 RepID=UPI0039EB4965